jgi:hypothetical protein
MQANLRAVLVSYSVWFINEYPDNWLLFRTGDFDVDKLETVVNCDLFGYFSETIFNRTGTQILPPKLCRAKEKVGANPPDETAALRASGELYGKHLWQAS